MRIYSEPSQEHLEMISKKVASLDDGLVVLPTDPLEKFRLGKLGDKMDLLSFNWDS